MIDAERAAGFDENRLKRDGAMRLLGRTFDRHGLELLDHGRRRGITDDVLEPVRSFLRGRVDRGLHRVQAQRERRDCHCHHHNQSHRESLDLIFHWNRTSIPFYGINPVIYRSGF